jgi:hypothetical protein
MAPTGINLKRLLMPKLFRFTDRKNNLGIKLPISLALLLVLSCGTPATVIELPAARSMLITGKGPGQDGAINPYSGTNSVSVVKNIGDFPFSVRVQDKEGNYEEFQVLPGEKREVFLSKDNELYLDNYLETRAKVSFRKPAGGNP